MTTLGERIQRGLALLALLNCVIVPLWFSATLAAYQELFPLPFLYFVEIALTGIAAFWLVYQSDHRHWLWALGGILLAFVVLGSFTIGLFLAPAFLLVSMLAVWQTAAAKRWRAALLLPVGALAQSALMLLVIRLG